MKAINCIRPDHTIEDAALISIRWGDDTPSFYAIPRANVSATIEGAENQDAVAILIDDGEALAMQAAGAWIGMQVGACHGIGAWGHTKLTA